MVTSIILMNTKRGYVNEVAEMLAELDEISEVYSVSGNYDLVAVARIKSNDHLSDLVTKKLLKFDSIVHTETMLAFQAFSKHDLDAMFSLGVEK